MATDSQTTKDVLERFYAALMAWDEDAIRAVVHKDAELHQPPTLPYGDVYRGVDAMMKLWKDVIFRMNDEGTAYVDTMVFGEDSAAVVAGGKMNGKEVLACEDYAVRDGQITRIRIFWFDPTPVAEAAHALGVTASLA